MRKPIVSRVLCALGAVLLASTVITLFFGDGRLVAGKLVLGVIGLAAGFGLAEKGGLKRFFSGRALHYGGLTALSVLSLLVVLGILNWIAYKRPVSFDLTRDRIFTLQDDTVKTLKGLKSDVKALAVYRMDEEGYAPAEGLLKRYAAVSPHFTYEMVDPYRSPEMAKTYGVVSGGPRILLVSGEQKAPASAPDEQGVTNALVKVTRVGTRKVYFTQGHGEPDPTGQQPRAYGQMTKALEGEGYDVAPLSLLEKPEVPSDASVVVVAGARSGFLEAEVKALEAFAAKGGHLGVFLEPEVDPGLDRLLAAYGVQADEDVVVESLAGGANPGLARLAHRPALLLARHLARPHGQRAHLSHLAVARGAHPGRGDTDPPRPDRPRCLGRDRREGRLRAGGGPARPGREGGALAGGHGGREALERRGQPLRALPAGGGRGRRLLLQQVPAARGEPRLRHERHGMARRAGGPHHHPPQEPRGLHRPHDRRGVDDAQVLLGRRAPGGVARPRAGGVDGEEVPLEGAHPMKARTRSLASALAFLLVAVAAVALAFFGIAKKDEARAARKGAEEKLYTFAPARVKSLEVKSKGDDTRIVRAGEKWRLTAPVEAEAERAAVNALVEAVAGLRRKAAIAAKPDAAALARYGLSNPRARVTLTLEDGKSESLALGDENPFDGSAFVSTSGGAVDLVSGDIKWSLEKSAFDLREKRLLPFEEDLLLRIEVHAPRLSYALAREGGHYRLVSPVTEAADEATVSSVLSAIRGLRATSFLHPPEGDLALGLDTPRFTVTLASTGVAPRTLRIGAPPPKASPGEQPDTKGGTTLYARLEGSTEVATLPSGAASGLDLDLFALRDKKVLHFDRDKVAALRFTVNGTSFEATSDPGRVRVSQALAALASLEAKAFEDDGAKAVAAYGLDRPGTEVLLRGPDGGKLDRLALAERDGKVYARADSSPRIAQVDPSLLKALPHSADDLKDGSPTPTAVK